MTPERWAQVKDVLQRAMQLPPEKRTAFLDSACASDPSLRAEVESLLSAADHVRSSFLESRPDAELARGTRLGDYEIQSLLGAGGMGEVYRARDLRLRREVAIKVLPAYVSSDPERLRRFEQEAMAAAALNHPNILAVYQMGSYEGAPYLVSELLEGETLREQLRRGRIALKRSIDYGIQLARGLAAAYEKGIVHRDLKPENLFVTKEGRIKILDFGLAKLTQAHGSSANSALTVGEETEPGLVMGTAGYMSPEQVRGKSIDHRTDIFAFGAILYEMLTGRRAFQKPTSAEIMTAILNEEPVSISQLTPPIRPAMQRIVQRCLEKNPEQRFQSASDLAFALEALSDSEALSSSATAQITPRSRQKAYLKIAAAAVVGLMIVISAYFYLRRPAKLAEKDTVVLADFDNKTGDPIFDDTLKQALSLALTQSSYLQVLSDSKAASTLQLMRRPSNAPLTPEVTREICERSASKAWIGGSISNLGNTYIIGLKAVNCQSEDVIAQEQATATGKEKVLDTLAEAAGKLRGELGESLSNIRKSDTPLKQATTSSLEALKALSLGNKMLHEKGVEAAVPYYQHSIELDPDFATGYLALGKMYISLSQPARANGLFTKAYALREHSSDLEKFDIDSMYYQFVMRDLESTTRVYREWLSSYPESPTALGNLATAYESMGQYQQAADLSREALERRPDDVIGYGESIDLLMALNRLPEARATIQTAMVHHLDSRYLRSQLYSLAFLAGDARSMDEQVARLNNSSPQYSFSLQASTEAYSGHLRRSRELSQQSVDAAHRAGEPEAAASEALAAALRESLFGNLREAHNRALSLLHKSQLGEQGTEFAALLFASAGDFTQAESLSNALVKEYPKGTLVNFVILPTVRAQIELSKNHPEKSIRLLNAASMYELTDWAFRGCLYPVYVRGQAYLASKNGSAAEAEFRKILDHPGIVLTCETGALARLGLAQAYALEGNNSKARVAYGDFLTLWKDADPEIAVLKQAKEEYANLQ